MGKTTVPDSNLIEEYLSLFRITEKKYIVGLFQTGITVYKQQIRALNIFHCLVATQIINTHNSEYNIGIIGGGIAGITLAAAAAKIGVKVTLFEKRSIFMHMQYGCDTRIIHPNIYDWPTERSTFPYAEIPILQWRADTAANVTKQLVHEFQNIKTESKSKEIKTIFDCEIQKIDDLQNGEIKITYTTDDRKLNRSVNLLIFATGYGIERGVNSSSKTPSYWRNDDYAQQIITKYNKSYFLSGIGDGGLIDLFRIKILGFSIDSFLSQLQKLSEYNQLITELRNIKSQWLKLNKNANENTWLNEQFEKIDPSLYEGILKEYLEKRIIKNCKITLHGKQASFEENLNLNHISLLNAFIAFLMSRNTNFFTYTSGPLTEYPKGTYRCKRKKIQSTVIIRHGTDRKGILSESNLLSESEKKTIDKLEPKQRENLVYNNTNLLFPYSELHALLNSQSNKRFSFLTPETCSICSSFVAVLANTLRYHQIMRYETKKFRICLHRLVKNGESYGYQQITPYFGVGELNLHGSLGCIYDIERGIVGLSFQTGRILRITNELEEDYGTIISSLKIESTYKRFGNSALAIPILAELSNDRFCTNLVCFFESDDKDFFSNKDLISIAGFAIEGFMNYINMFIGNQILMNESDFDPLPIDEQFSFFESLNNPCFHDFINEPRILNLPKSRLVFKKYYSFDVTSAPSKDLLNLYNNGA